MFGRTHRLNALETRKQLLVAESEVNRTQLAAGLAAFRSEVHSIAAETRTVRAMITSAVILTSGLIGILRSRCTKTPSKSSWLDKLIHNANFLASIWQAFRSTRSTVDKD